MAIDVVSLPVAMRFVTPCEHGLDRTLAEVEREHIERTLREQDYRVPEAAKVLGLPRSSLYDRIRRFQIPLPPRR